MKLVFSTNLDDAKGDVGALNYSVDTRGNGEYGQLPLPRKGERVEISFKKWVQSRAAVGEGSSQYFSYELEVSDVTYNYGRGVVTVSLIIPPPWRSIAEWSEWFKKFRY